MKFFIDNNLGKQLAIGMKGFGENIVHLQEIFPEDIDDIKVLSYCGKNQYFFITRDYQIRYRPAELKAFKTHNVGAFILAGKNLNKWELIQQLVRNWLRIKELSMKTKLPFAFRIPPKGTKIKKIPID